MAEIENILSRGKFMQSLKETVLEYLKHQPDSIQAKDIIEFVILNKKLLEGEQDLQNGKIYSHEQAVEILKKWRGKAIPNYRQ